MYKRQAQALKVVRHQLGVHQRRADDKQAQPGADSDLDVLDVYKRQELDSVDEEDGSEADKAYISTRDNNVEVRYALNEAIKFSPAEEAANAAASRRSKVVNYAQMCIRDSIVALALCVPVAANKWKAYRSYSEGGEQ